LQDFSHWIGADLLTVGDNPPLISSIIGYKLKNVGERGEFSGWISSRISSYTLYNRPKQIKHFTPNMKNNPRELIQNFKRIRRLKQNLW
jgi:hypothetical protein